MPYSEEASTAEMVNYTMELRIHENVFQYLDFFIIIPRVTSTPCHHPDITKLYDTTP